MPRDEWEKELSELRGQIRSTMIGHREISVVGWEAPEHIDEDTELVLEEEVVHAPVSALKSRSPPSTVQGASGWIYHSTSFLCLRVYDSPRKYAIMLVESSFFDPLILLTIMCNCFTMAVRGQLRAYARRIRARIRAQTGSAADGPRVSQPRATGVSRAVRWKGAERRACALAMGWAYAC